MISLRALKIERTIAKLLADDPAMSNGEIAAAINEQGVLRRQRGGKWFSVTVADAINASPKLHALPRQPTPRQQTPRGRPPTPIGTQIGMRWQEPTLKAVDDWRREQPDLPSRTEAIRRLVEQGLAAPKRKGR
jgi:hypothetical protein